jgi:hypothetical protein
MKSQIQFLKLVSKELTGFCNTFKRRRIFFFKVAGEYEHSNAKTLGGMGLYQSESNMATIAR